MLLWGQCGESYSTKQIDKRKLLLPARETSWKDSFSAWFCNKTSWLALELFSILTVCPRTGFFSSPPGAMAGLPALPHMPCCPASWLQFKNLYNSGGYWGAFPHFQQHKLSRRSPSHADRCRWGEGLWVPMQVPTELHVEVSCMDGWMDWFASWSLNFDNVMFTATNFQAKKWDYFYITLWLTLHQHRHA